MPGKHGVSTRTRFESVSECASFASNACPNDAGPRLNGCTGCGLAPYGRSEREDQPLVADFILGPRTPGRGDAPGDWPTLAKKRSGIARKAARARWKKS